MSLPRPPAVFLALALSAAPAAAQTPSTAAPAAQQKGTPAAPAVSTAAPAELAGYRQAAWGMTKDEAKAALQADFNRGEPNSSTAELPWELLHLANIAESDPDDLLGGDLEWFYGDRQDSALGFYKDRFFFYACSLDKVLPPAEYQQAIAARHGRSSRTVSYQTRDPAAPNETIGSYTIELWEKKKTTIALAVEKLFPGEEPEVNYEVAYFSPEIFGEFRADFSRALAAKVEAEKKQAEELLQEQRRSALEVLQ